MSSTTTRFCCLRFIELVFSSDVWLAISFPVTTFADHEEDWIDNIPTDRLKRLLGSQTCPIFFQRQPLDFLCRSLFALHGHK
jgi:hypothetical protein